MSEKGPESQHNRQSGLLPLNRTFRPSTNESAFVLDEGSLKPGDLIAVAHLKEEPPASIIRHKHQLVKKQESGKRKLTTVVPASSHDYESIMRNYAQYNSPASALISESDRGGYELKAA